MMERRVVPTIVMAIFENIMEHALPELVLMPLKIVVRLSTVLVVLAQAAHPERQIATDFLPMDAKLI